MVHFFILVCFPAVFYNVWCMGRGRPPRNPLCQIKILRIRRHRLSCCPSSLGISKTEKKTEDPGRSSPLHSRSHREIFQSMETTLRFSGCNILVQEYSKPALPKAQQKAIWCGIIIAKTCQNTPACFRFSSRFIILKYVESKDSIYVQNSLYSREYPSFLVLHRTTHQLLLRPKT